MKRVYVRSDENGRVDYVAILTSEELMTVTELWAGIAVDDDDWWEYDDDE